MGKITEEADTPLQVVGSVRHLIPSGYKESRTGFLVVKNFFVDMLLARSYLVRTSRVFARGRE